MDIDRGSGPLVPIWVCPKIGSAFWFVIIDVNVYYIIIVIVLNIITLLVTIIMFLTIVIFLYIYVYRKYKQVYMYLTISYYLLLLIIEIIYIYIHIFLLQQHLGSVLFSSDSSCKTRHGASEKGRLAVQHAASDSRVKQCNRHCPMVNAVAAASMQVSVQA